MDASSQWVVLLAGGDPGIWLDRTWPENWKIEQIKFCRLRNEVAATLGEIANYADFLKLVKS